MDPKPNQSLPYWMFFISGGLITGYSAFIINQGKTDNVNAMKLFLYIGLFLIFVGFMKLLWGLFANREKKFAQDVSGVTNINRMEQQFMNSKMNSRNIPQNSQMNSQMNSQINVQANLRGNERIIPNQQNNKFIYCSKCGNRCFADSFYCSRCGNLLR